MPRLFSNLGWSYTYILVKDDFMINVHWIKAKKSLKFREGGYPLGFDHDMPKVVSIPGAELAMSDDKISFIRSLYGYDIQYPAEALEPKRPENNIRYKYSVVPSLGFDSNEKSTFYLASMVYGKLGNDSVDNLMSLVKDFQIVDGLVKIKFYDDEEAAMQLGKIRSTEIVMNGTKVSGKIVLARVSQTGEVSQIVQA